jgi:tRNA(adenine34) deaminase
MQRALELAHAAVSVAEVPVGCVLVHDHTLIAGAHNLTRTIDDPTAHAEMVVLRKAAARLGTARLLGTTLYVTLEPCAMCAGALVQSRVKRLVFATEDPKAGFCGSLGNLVQDPRLNHRLEVQSGVLREECAALLKEFFTALRLRQGAAGAGE